MFVMFTVLRMMTTLRERSMITGRNTGAPKSRTRQKL